MVEDEIRSLRRQVRVLQILLAFSLVLSCSSFVILARVAQESVNASWQTLGMFQSLSKDQQLLRRDVGRLGESDRDAAADDPDDPDDPDLDGSPR